MTHLELREDNIPEIVAAFVDAARGGGLIIFPTDTVYGLGGAAFSRRVMEKLQAIKPERPAKPTAVLIDNIIRMSQCSGEVPSPKLVALTEAFWPGPLTLIWKTSGAIPQEFQTPDRSLGYRVPNIPYLLEVLRELESPLWATSANFPGRPAARLFTEIPPALLQTCDLVIQAQQLLTGGKASTVVDIRGREPVVMREGSIREEDIRRVWKGK
jgi:L-threonylcarbamoyladenylate synthase